MPFCPACASFERLEAIFAQMLVEIAVAYDPLAPTTPATILADGANAFLHLSDDVYTRALPGYVALLREVQDPLFDCEDYPLQRSGDGSEGALIANISVLCEALQTVDPLFDCDYSTRLAEAMAFLQSTEAVRRAVIIWGLQKWILGSGAVSVPAPEEMLCECWSCSGATLPVYVPMVPGLEAGGVPPVIATESLLAENLDPLADGLGGKIAREAGVSAAISALTAISADPVATDLMIVDQAGTVRKMTEEQFFQILPSLGALVPLPEDLLLISPVSGDGLQANGVRWGAIDGALNSSFMFGTWAHFMIAATGGGTNAQWKGFSVSSSGADVDSATTASATEGEYTGISSTATNGSSDYLQSDLRGIYMPRSTRIDISMKTVRTSGRFFIGWTDGDAAAMVSADDPAGNYMGIQYSDNRADSEWKLVTKNGTTQNLAATGFPLNSTVKNVSIIWNPTSGFLELWVDGTKLAQSNTNLPANGTVMRFNLGVFNLGSAIQSIKFTRLFMQTAYPYSI